MRDVIYRQELGMSRGFSSPIRFLREFFPWFLSHNLAENQGGGEYSNTRNINECVCVHVFRVAGTVLPWRTPRIEAILFRLFGPRNPSNFQENRVSARFLEESEYFSAHLHSVLQCNPGLFVPSVARFVFVSCGV